MSGEAYVTHRATDILDATPAEKKKQQRVTANPKLDICIIKGVDKVRPWNTGHGGLTDAWLRVCQDINEFWTNGTDDDGNHNREVKVQFCKNRWTALIQEFRDNYDFDKMQFISGKNIVPVEVQAAIENVALDYISWCTKKVSFYKKFDSSHASIRNQPSRLQLSKKTLPNCVKIVQRRSWLKA